MTLQTSAPKKRMPFIVAVIIAVIIICIFCTITSFAMDALGLIPTPTPTLPPTITPLPTETTTPLPPTATLAPIDELRQRIETSLGDGNRDLPRLTAFTYADTDNSMYIEWTINDNFTVDFIFTGAQTDVTDMLKIIDESGLLPNYQIVTFAGTFPLIDNFGNTEEENVIFATYNRATVDKINWEGFLYPNIFEIADQAIIHPAIRP